ncbi:MAG: murein hydrolase activator EnvC family protein, partial [Burkholderiales bacterium]
MRVGKRAIIAAGRFAAALCLLGAAHAAHADEDNEAKLEQVRARLEVLRAEMREDLEERESLDARLRDSEEQVAAVSRKLGAIHDEQAASEKRLDELQAEQAGREAAIAAERAALAGQIRAAWMSGRQERLKLILNQQDPAALGRLMVYYDYFNRLRASRIEGVERQLAALDRVGVALEREQERLRGLEASQAGELERLRVARREREASIAVLGERIEERGGEVARLEGQEKTLVELIEELRRAVAELPVTGDAPFESLRGKLEWPIAGHL